MKRHARAQARLDLEALEIRCVPAVVFGDFDGDGRLDLAAGAPGASADGGARGGTVHVAYGNASGYIATARTQTWHAGSFGETPQAGDRFGAALAVGYFNDDLYADLAIGIPGRDLGPIPDAGAVRILYGSPTGLRAAGAQLWTQDSPGVPEQAAAHDEFGSVLAAGDFDGNGRTDLAVGVPNENLRLPGSAERIDRGHDAGVVHVFYSYAAGLSAVNTQLIQQGVSGTAVEGYDFFGAALAAADFNGDGRAELVIGVPGQNVNGKRAAGEINIVRGTASGLDLSALRVFHQDLRGFTDPAEPFDYFGSSLAVGNFNGGNRDIAVGVPGQTQGALDDAGAVHVLYNVSVTSAGASFASSTGYRLGVWWAGAAGAGELYGHALAAGDLNSDGRDDLVVGVPFEDVGAATDAGGIHVLYGSNTGLQSPGLLLTQATHGVGGSADRDEQFGAALAVAPRVGGLPGLIAVGVPGDRAPGGADSGAVNVISHRGGTGIEPGGALILRRGSFSGQTARFGDSLGGERPLGGDAPVPALETDPGSSGPKLLLDFNGYRNEDRRNVPGFTLDDRAGMNRTERALIRDIWAHVAEDYAPFRINVTTIEDPDFTWPNEFRVAIGGTSRQNDEEDLWGIAYASGIDLEAALAGFSLINTGAFVNNSLRDNQVYVFSAEITRGARPLADVAHIVATVASHEAGHGFDLGHKSDVDSRIVWPFSGTIREYSNGTPTWAPIMGGAAFFPEKRSTWSQEEYHPSPSSSNVIEGNDDMKDLGHALRFRADDHGDTTATATDLGTLTTANPSRLVAGLIGKHTDADVFRFTVTVPTQIRIRLDAADVGPNLAAKLQLLTRSGTATTLVAEDASTRDLGGTVELLLRPGTYYVNVLSDAVLTGDVGRYTLRIEPGSGLGVAPPPGLDTLPLPLPAPPGLTVGLPTVGGGGTTAPGAPGGDWLLPPAPSSGTASKGAAAGSIDPQPEPVKGVGTLTALPPLVKVGPQPEPPTKGLPDLVKVGPQPEPPTKPVPPVTQVSTVKVQTVAATQALQTGLETVFVSPWRIL